MNKVKINRRDFLKSFSIFLSGLFIIPLGNMLNNKIKIKEAKYYKKSNKLAG